LTGAAHAVMIRRTVSTSDWGAVMTSTATFQTRLASTDPTLLRQRGPAADQLRRSLLAGSRVAVIEPGYDTKRFVYERARALGVDLVLVADGSSWARQLVEEGVAARLVAADTTGSGDAGVAAQTVLAALGGEAERLDGVVTFWEDAVPATARIAAALGLPAISPAAADNTRNKLRTLEASSAAGLPTARFIHLDDAATLPAAAAHVGFPAVIKPLFGAEAMGCLRVDEYDSLVEGYARVAALISPELNLIFEQGTDLLLEEYLDGTEFDIDLVLCGGECVFSAISENWPTEEPYFVETGLHTPSDYPRERLEALTDLCVRTALALGIEDGALHAEAKDTSRGPRLLEMNGRLGGGVIPKIHRIVTGVDLIEQQLLLAVGLPAAPTPHPVPAAGAVNLFLHASRSGTLRHTRFFDHLAGDPTVIQHDVTVHAGEPVIAAADGFPTVLGKLTVHADDAAAAQAKMDALVAALDIPYEP
jgi:biotin carboxylase